MGFAESHDGRPTLHDQIQTACKGHKAGFICLHKGHGRLSHERQEVPQALGQCRKAGIRKGAYHFFRSSKDPVQQAKLFIRTVGNIGQDDLPPVLDIETIHKGCSRETLNSRALTWLKEVEKHYGRKPVVYSSAYFIRDILSKEIKEHYPIWVAHYEKDTPMHEGWHIWQFSDKAVVYGIEGYVDLNISTPAQLEKL